MFRRTDRQLPLLGAEQGLAPGARQRLSGSWAEGFRRQVMPELLAAEERFASLYSEEGRPNWSVARLLAVCLLQHQSGLSDQEALDALSFDVRWQHALSLGPDDAYLSRRSLVEFRRRLVQRDPDGHLIRDVFDRICAAGVKQLGLSTAEQRLDSTLIASNIRTRGRLGLARETLRHFIRALPDSERSKLPQAVLTWFDTKEEGWDYEESAQQAPQRLHEMGQWIVQVLSIFSNAKSIAESEPYRLLSRMAEEHADSLGLQSADPTTGDLGSDDHTDDDAPPSAPSSSQNNPGSGHEERGKEKRKSRTNTQRARYWSVHDPDASFGHKGCGYHVHITETCRNADTELLTDYDVLTAAQGDVGQTTPAITRLEQRGLTPDVLYADAGYPTPAELVSISAKGIELCAPVHRGKLPKDTFSRSEFEFERETGHVLSCPQGHAPTRHAERESSDTMHPRRSLHVFFDAEDCRVCPHLKRCPTRQPNNNRSREYRLDIAPELLARDARWSEQHTDEFKQRYRIRGGVEATMSELKRAHRMGRLRVRRLARVRLQVAFKATACNVKRWLRALLVLLCRLASAVLLSGGTGGRFAPNYLSISPAT